MEILFATIHGATNKVDIPVLLLSETALIHFLT